MSWSYSEEIVDRLDTVWREREKYRVALEQIAGQNSGVWGWIANEALTGRPMPDVADESFDVTA